MKVELMAHQKHARDFVMANRGVGALFHEVGTGKTISALSIFEEERKLDPKIRMLVICPLSLIEGAWIKEINQHTDFLWHDLHSGKRSGMWNVRPDIYLVNFEHMISVKKFEALRLLLREGPWMCAIDESSKMKNNRSKTVERILALRSLFKSRVLMSGTPAPNIEWEYWPQMFFLNDSILGNNFYKFKNTYFALSRGRQQMESQYMNRQALHAMFKQGFKYGIIASKREAMFNQMKPWCHLVKSKDCLDLPEEIDEMRVVEMNDDQKRVYKEMRENYIAEIKAMPSGDSTFAVANVALTKIMRLRQITSGFIVDETGQAKPVTPSNPKMNELVEIIEECGQEQMIIWCQFHWEIDEVFKILSAIEGAGISQLHGRIKQEHRIGHLDDFISGKNRFLIAHPDSAAHGLTLVNCHIQVFYSLSYSLEEYNQARGRTMRKGQRNNCVYFHLLCKESIDNDVLAVLKNKITTNQLVENYLRGVR